MTEPMPSSMPSDPNPMPRWSNLWGREPVLVLAVVQAALALVVSFGFDLSGEQTGAIMAFIAAALGLIVRRRVTPT